MTHFKRTLRFPPFITEKYILGDLVFTLKLYDTREQMHRAIRRADKRAGAKGWDMTGTMGLFRGFTKVRIDDDGNEDHDDILGDLMLNIADLTDHREKETNGDINIIAHECQHAVIAYVRAVRDEIPSFDPIMSDDDEQLESEANEIMCDFQGRLTACVIAWVDWYEEQKKK